MPTDEPVSRRILMGTATDVLFGRRLMSRLPSQPRCKLCSAPFHPPFGPIMRLLGKKPWPNNPKYCSSCFAEMIRYREGAEIPCSLLFADVRGSTTLG